MGQFEEPGYNIHIQKKNKKKTLSHQVTIQTNPPLASASDLPLSPPRAFGELACCYSDQLPPDRSGPGFRGGSCEDPYGDGKVELLFLVGSIGDSYQTNGDSLR